jgi:hypothetical protein
MKQVDELIRGEISAVESFRAVLPKIKDNSERTALEQMLQDHVRAVDKLKRFAESKFEEKAQTSGPWGAFTKAFAGGASFFGDKAALTALKVGEQHGINEYQEAVKDDSINAEIRTLIQSELLPNQQKHLQTINKYLQ